MLNGIFDRKDMKGIKYLDLKAVNAAYEEEIKAEVAKVVESGWYLQGERIERFESHYAEYTGTSFCISCGNGLDALRLMLQGEIILGRLSPGDEVMVPANTYIATILAITTAGLTPVLIEPRLDTLQIDDSLVEEHISPKTRAILSVHLYGRCSITPRLLDICKRHQLLLFEDNAQAHGCMYVNGTEKGKRTGSLGDAAAHSFYPGKNLGALGDAGAITTNDAELAKVVRTLGNYGSSKKYVFDYQGSNSRMDEVQAAVLDVKLAHLDQDNKKRQKLAKAYTNILEKHSLERESQGVIPRNMFSPIESNVVHIFPILSPRRDELQQYLAAQGVGTLIHYPIPPHRQKCYAERFGHLHLPITEKIHKEELSLPCNPSMTENDVERIALLIQNFSNSSE